MRTARPLAVSLLALACTLPAAAQEAAPTQRPEVVAAGKAMQQQVIDWRRHFHQYPELSNREEQTARRVAEELRKQERVRTMPARNHAMVLVSKLHMPTLRALSYAKAVRPDVLEAVTVNVDDGDTRRLVAEWEKENFKIPLKVIESPYREITKPVLDYVKRVKSDNPRDVVTVFIPEYVY